MKRIFFFLLLFSASVPLGCQSYDDLDLDAPPISGFAYEPGPRCFAPREVNYLWAIPIVCEESSLCIQIETFNQLLDRRTYPGCYLDSWMNVDAPLPQLEAIRSKLAEMIDYVHIVPMDEMVEYVRTFRDKHPNILIYGPVFPMLLEYRTEGVADMTVTSDRALFGKEPGESLNEYFMVQCYADSVDQIGCYSYDNFEWISCLYIPHVGRVTFMNDWLARKPLITSDFRLYTKGAIPKQEMETATIIVDVTTTMGKQFRASHKICSHSDLGIDSRIDYYQQQFLATRVDR